MSVEETDDVAKDVFLLVPHVRILRGRVAVPRERGYVPLGLARYSDDTIEFFRSLSTEYKTILISDLDGIGKNRPQLDLLQKVERECDFNDIWVDGGARISDNVIDLFVVGATSVVLNTRTIYGLKEIRESCRLSQNLMLHIASRNHIVSHDAKIRNMEPEQLMRTVRGYGICDFIIDRFEFVKDSVKSPDDFHYFVVDDGQGFATRMMAGDGVADETRGTNGMNGVILNIELLMDKDGTLKPYKSWSHIDRKIEKVG